MSTAVVYENLLVLFISLLNSSVIIASYRRGGEAWVEKFGVRKHRKDGSVKTTSGAYGELIINAIWTVGYLAVLNSGARYSIFNMGLWHIVGFGLLALGFFIWAYRFPIKVLEGYRHRPQGFRERLSRGYSFYWIFTVNFYMGMFFTASRLVHHYMNDVASFFERASDFLARHAEAIRSSDRLDLELAAELERAHVEFSMINRSIIHQLEPVVLFALYVIIVLSLIAYTPLKYSFHANTRRVGYMASGVALVIVIATAMASYFFQYTGFSDTYQEQLLDAVQLSPTHIAHTEVVVGILTYLMRFDGISGFFRIFTDEGGLYVVAMALTQIGAGIVTEDAEEGDDEPVQTDQSRAA